MANPQIVPATLNTGNFTAASLTSVTVAANGTPSKGNAMIAAMVIEGVAADPGLIAPPNANWKSISQNTIGNSGLPLQDRVAVFTAFAQDGESGSYTFNWANLAALGFWIFAEYSGGDDGTILDGSGSNQQNASGVNAGAPLLTPSSWNGYDTMICVWASTLVVGLVQSISSPNSLTLQALSNSGAISLPAIGLGDLWMKPGGSIINRNALLANAAQSLGISFLLRQSPWAALSPMGGNSS